MNEITTRTALVSDLEILLGFEQGVIEAERPFDPTIQEEGINYYDLRHMISAENVELIVAELNGEVIGSGYARIEESKVYLKHPRHAYLGFMYVKPDQRGKGVNNKVIAALKHWSVTRGVTEFRLEVYYDNLPAIKAYEKVGFEKLMLKMRMGINEIN
jgi:ribosomal protein S18 acetylase RimI-like enzyme